MAKQSIVPGARDLIPPQGRVTVQLLDPDRPWRVRKEVQAENAIMDWWLSGIKEDGFLGEFESDDEIQYKAGFTLNGAATNAGFDHFSWAAGKFGSEPGLWPGRFGNYINHFWASSANVSPDSSKPWIPTNNVDGDLTAWGNLDVTSPVDVVNYPERGTVVASESWSKWNQSRMVLEWSTDVGNGTWRSAGIGTVIANITGGGVKPAPYSLYGRVPTLRSIVQNNQLNARSGGVQSFGTGNQHPATSMHHFSPAELWTIDRDGYIGAFNMASWVHIYDNRQTGLGTDQQYGIVKLNGKLWVVRSGLTNLYEYDDDLSSTLTLDTTIDISGDISGDTIYDITTDGTDLFVLGSSSVHKLDNVGTYVSSWAHGQTLERYQNYHRAPSIEYDPAMGHLWVSRGNSTRHATGGAITLPWGGYRDNGDAVWASGNERVWAYSTSGTQLNYTWHPFWYIGDDPYEQVQSIQGMDPQGWNFWGTSSWYTQGQEDYGYYYPQGPSAASHAVLPSDVVKTNSDALKVVYDFDFS